MKHRKFEDLEIYIMKIEQANFEERILNTEIKTNFKL